MICENLKVKEREKTMMERGKRNFYYGVGLIVVFLIWTKLMQTIDVQPWGINGSKIGFATLNGWFHKLTGVHMVIYYTTDWLGLVPVLVCFIFATIGLTQWIKRKKLLKVDYDILFLGIYYIVVIAGYLIFEIIPINYRPILIEGRMEASYPSSTTLLVLGVMPTLMMQANRRLKHKRLEKILQIVVYLFTTFMVLGRLISGVHWLTDIIGSVLLSFGLFYLYKSAVLWYDKTNK